MNDHVGIRFMICKNLKSDERCFVVRRYFEGEWTVLCHEHVPKSRMSSDSACSALKALLAKYSGYIDSVLLSGFMNSKSKNPERSRMFDIDVSYPEPGVLRKGCYKSNTEGWVDEVISKDKFRI